MRAPRNGSKWSTVIFLLIISVWMAPALAGPKLPSLKKGDPPPGDAAAMSDQSARITLESALHHNGEIHEIRYGRDWFQFSSASRDSGQTAQRGQRFVGQEMFASSFSSAYSSGSAIRASDSAFAGRSYELSKVSVKKSDLLDTAQGFVRYADITDYVRVDEHGGLYSGSVRTRNSFLVLKWSNQDDAQAFADALNRLAYSAHAGQLDSNQRTAFEQFQQHAEAWRQIAVKPALPAEADRYRVLAANAYQEKQIENAAMYYDQGLALSDTWSDGWFNSAQIDAELGEYWEAADHIRHYLELAPDSADAKAARESLVIWDEKAKNEGQAPDSADKGGFARRRVHKSAK